MRTWIPSDTPSSEHTDDRPLRIPRARILTFLCILILCLPVHVEGQIQNLSFTRLNVAQGLQRSTVYCMVQDSRGFMWFGTPAGLCRYDGYTFKLYDTTDIYALTGIHEDKHGSLWFTPSGEIHRLDLATERITCYRFGSGIRSQLIFEDRGGNLWVTTRGDGLAKYIPSADSFFTYRHNPRDTSTLCCDSVYAFCEDRQGRLWFGTARGMDRFDRETGTFVHCSQVSMNAVFSIIEDEDQSLWLGTTNGLGRLDQARGQFKRYKSQDVPDNLVYSLHLTRRNELWMALGNHIARFDRSAKGYEIIRGSYPDTAIGMGGYSINSFFEDRRGRLWVCTFAGLALFDRTNEVLQVIKPRPGDPNSMVEGYVNKVMEDNTGNVWIATANGGVCVLDDFRPSILRVDQTPYINIQLSHGFVSALLEDSAGNLWVGSHHGLDRVELSTGRRTHYDRDEGDDLSLPGRRIFEIVEDGADILWLATSGGLCSLERKSGKLTTFRHHANEVGIAASQMITSICIDEAGAMWIGGGVQSGLLMRFDRTSRRYTNYYFPDPSGFLGELAYPIPQIFESSSGILWFTGRIGGSFDRVSREVRLHGHDSTLSGYSCIYEDAVGGIWMGSYRGLSHFDSTTDSFSRFPIGDEVGDDFIFEILGDNSGSLHGSGNPGNLWLLTQKGIARFTPATGVVRNYGPAEGVPIAAADFVHAGFKNRKGYLYFGGSNGLVVFHPDSIHDHTFIPPIAITSFKKFNNEVALDSATTAKRIIELSYDENVISFAFAALNYVRPEKNQYAYMLEGFDRDWVYCGTRRTTMYTNLDPGAYVFRVKGSNNEGVWNEAGASLVLIVHPPFWKTWWAYLLYALFTMALLYSAFRFQHNRLILRHEVEVKEVETRKLKEVNEIKSRFFANISHEFRTPLTLILGPIHKWQERVQEEGLKKDLSMAERNAHRLLRLINQLLDLSKLEVGGMKLHARCMNIVPLVKGIAYSFESSAGIRGITLKVSVDHDERQAYCDKDVIENFLTNLLSNAMKFTPKGGSVGVTVKRVTERGEFVEIGVSDTGIGIAEEHLTHIFDRFYQVDDSTTREQGGTGIGSGVGEGTGRAASWVH